MVYATPHVWLWLWVHADLVHMHLEILRVILFMFQCHSCNDKMKSVRWGCLILIRVGYGKGSLGSVDPLDSVRSGSGPIGRPFGPQKRNNDKNLVCEELHVDDFLKGMGFSSSLIVRMWMRSCRVVGANYCQCYVATVLGSIPASSNTMESEELLLFLNGKL